MRFALCSAAALSALAGLARGQQGEPYNLFVTWTQGTKEVGHRLWYGDGNLYIGSEVPSGIHTAFNFTVPNARANLLYIEPSSGTGASLPDPTFLVVNDAPGEAAPIWSAHSAAGLGDTDLIFWTRYSTLVFAVGADGNLLQGYFLDATDRPDTFVLKWRSKNTAAAAAARDTMRRGERDREERQAPGIAVNMVWRSASDADGWVASF